MLFGILTFLFIILCLLLILIILLQKGKSSIGLGALGGGTQLLFGGSGGQDLFQKITWAMGGLFMFGSLILAMMKRPSESDILQQLAAAQTQQQAPVAVPAVPKAPVAPVTPEEKPKASA